MDEIEIKKLPVSDEFEQCMRKLRKVDEGLTERRKKEIRECNHLFVLLRKGKITYGCHSTDYYYDADEVECVHCGLTNKFNKLETTLSTSYNQTFCSFNGMLPSPTKYMKKTIESEMFEEIFRESYLREGKTFNNRTLNLISDEPLLTCHPKILYRLALIINSKGNNEELFVIMKKLHLIETPQEKIRLQVEEQAVLLLERYYNLISPKKVLKRLSK